LKTTPPLGCSRGADCPRDALLLLARVLGVATDGGTPSGAQPRGGRGGRPFSIGHRLGWILVESIPAYRRTLILAVSAKHAILSKQR
jgi:hypothetical protein